MVMVDVDDELYSEIKKVVEDNRIEYPTFQNFVNKAIRDKINKEKKK